MTPAPPPRPASVDLAELIRQLEDAKCSMRHLDALIATAVWGEPQPSGNTGGPKVLTWWDRGLGRSVAPEFTASTDAALSLVPEGCFVTIDKYLVSDERPDIWRAWVKWFPDDATSELAKAFSGLRSTPALALCIAALKALAALRAHQGGER
jgi:hypothetical protein